MITHFYIIVLLASITSCNTETLSLTGEGDIATQTIPLSKFKKIKLMGIANVELLTGDTLEAVVEDYQNIIQYMDVKVVGSTLIIANSSNINVRNSVGKVVVTASEDVEVIKTMGSGDMILGSSFSKLKEVTQTGSGNIIAEHSSQTGHLDVYLTGSGNLNFKEMTTNSFACVSLGSGNITIQVLDYLEANLAGSGCVYYSGNPELKVSKNGSGDVIQL